MAWRGRGPASALPAEPERAARHSVRPPRAIALSGPPAGTATFARGIAAQLGWPFVELLTSRPADEGNLAAAVRSAFARIAELERALVFIDEVEETAPVRSEAAQPGRLHGVTHELLKLLPGFRERDERLLVCDQLHPLARPGVPAPRPASSTPPGWPPRRLSSGAWRRSALGTGAHARLGASTEGHLAAITWCRPTVTPGMTDEFSADITAHARR
ncbi:AAA family ATPase [Streptomyces sp. NPDC015125]|uniref:AAA family ATPase n=1 Tax=Streptomyces sp. NPDC015125 TaxID=3364938 RepID=UPI0036FB026A